MVTVASGCSCSIAHPLSFETMKQQSEEALEQKLAGSSVNTNSIITSPLQHLCLGRKKVGDGEIGVFGADKYFNGVMDVEDPRSSKNGAINYRKAMDERVKPVETCPVKPKVQPITPSVQSESSWNSRIELLENVTRNPRPRKSNKRNCRSLLASLGCNCACRDKNCVDIDDNIGESNSKTIQEKPVKEEPIKSSSVEVNLAQRNQSPLKIDEVGTGFNRDEFFSFPILNSTSGNLAVKVRPQEEEDDEQRKSLEVFGCPVLDKKKSLTLEKRITLLTGEGHEIRASSDGMFFETESDASSDLFEIESLTRNINQIFPRNSSEGMSSCATPTTCYAPSEASVEWSVATASAADLSVPSDSEEPMASETSNKARKMASNAKTPTRKEGERWRSGVLLGCKSHKAVRVAGEAHRTNEKAASDPKGKSGQNPMHRAQGFRLQID